MGIPVLICNETAYSWHHSQLVYSRYSRLSGVKLAAVHHHLVCLLHSILSYQVNTCFMLVVAVRWTQLPWHLHVSFQMLLLRDIISLEVWFKRFRNLHWTQVCFGSLYSLLPLIEVVATRYPRLKRLDQLPLDVTLSLMPCSLFQTVNLARIEVPPANSGSIHIAHLPYLC